MDAPGRTRGVRPYSGDTDRGDCRSPRSPRTPRHPRHAPPAFTHPWKQIGFAASLAVLILGGLLFEAHHRAAEEAAEIEEDNPSFEPLPDTIPADWVYFENELFSIRCPAILADDSLPRDRSDGLKAWYGRQNGISYCVLFDRTGHEHGPVPPHTRQQKLSKHLFVAFSNYLMVRKYDEYSFEAVTLDDTQAVGRIRTVDSPQGRFNILVIADHGRILGHEKEMVIRSFQAK